MATHVLNLQLELSLGPLVSALEGQMLKKVSSSIGLVGFSTRSGIDVNANSAGGSVGIVFGSDGQAVGQLPSFSSASSQKSQQRVKHDLPWSTVFVKEVRQA